jgi:hypothetical protein
VEKMAKVTKKMAKVTKKWIREYVKTIKGYKGQVDKDWALAYCKAPKGGFQTTLSQKEKKDAEAGLLKKKFSILLYPSKLGWAEASAYSF